MGNVCSSGQKKNKKDDTSEKSEDSPSYQPAFKSRNSKENNDVKIAPLADPEPISDISGCQNASFVTNSSTNGHLNRNSNTKITSVSESISSTPHSATAPTDLSASKSLPHNLIGLQGKPKTARRIERDKKIVIYVLATDCDQEIEKQTLHKLYPMLSERCAYRGFEILISDSHDSIEDSNIRSKILDVRKWCETPLEAKGGHEEAASCLAEITRHTNFSYVIPVLFLGTTLGRPLLPLTIESQDFTSALNLADDSIKSLMEKWYTFDNASQPVCYRLNTTDVLKNPIESNKQLEELLLGLVNVFSKELRDSYLTTVVEQEINNTILMSQELSKRCLWLQTGIIPPKLPDSPTLLESEVNRRLTNIHSELRNQLSEKNLIRIPPTIQIPDEQLSSIMESLLNTIIDGIVDEHSTKFAIPKCTYGVDRRLLEDVEIVAQYSKMLGQNCANFSILEDIKDYIVGESYAPLVIHGGIGSGKSVLTSKIMNNIHIWMPECNLIVRYSNLTDISSDYVALVGSIAEQLSVISNGEACRTIHTFEAYVEFIKNILDSIKLYVTIVIDSLDEINNFTNLSWLPKKLLPNVKIIFTTSKWHSSKRSPFMDELSRLDVHSGNFMELVSFSDEQWRDVLSFGGGDFYAANGVLQLPEKWQNCPEKSPLQAKILWWLAWLGIYELDDISTDAIVKKMIDTIESKINSDYVQFLLILLVINRNGIRETDCLAIFQKAHSLDNVTAYKVWYTFCWLMGPMLLHMRKVQIIDKLLKITILTRYEQKLSEFHQLISDHFTNKKSIYADQKEKFFCYNEEKFLKLPYHNYMTMDRNSQIDQQSFFNKSYFTDLVWYHNKLMATGCVQILSDISLIENHLKSIDKKFEIQKHITILKQFLQNHIRELNYDGSQFYSLLKVVLGKCLKNDSALEKNPIIQNWIEFLKNMKQTYLEPNNYNNLDIFEDFGFSSYITKTHRSGFDSIVNLTNKGNFVASISTERSEICVWDVPNCKRVRTLTGVIQPTLLVPVGDYEVAVLCKREIKVLNLDEGKFKVTLKGVMNQKMPYFGLHDPKHLVCLSRNRMYVNLMNLESGDCVTTFKAGEDRFLNSLLVSGDGRILVCGDETQKPFPLLVWHLSQRKLLYDLRIPHHDFLTTLSAITYEGSYVCVVAKELNEPTPNFIVVYDLQSGTLFKKWKPSCNTVSLAISQSNACVIAGLDDARILIWDLVTGNCKYTLTGHNAPVTFLKLDPLGKILLSGDRDGRDMSIRLWELRTGKPLAVYTPKRKILSCEILPNGKYVILALENLRNLTTLIVKNIKDDGINDNLSVKYGSSQNDGKTFDLDKDVS